VQKHTLSEVVKQSVDGQLCQKIFATKIIEID